MKTADVALMGSVIAVIGLIAFSVDFRGDFPINDDWGYATPVRWWSEDKVLRLTHWQSMPLLTQIAAGIAWTEIVGFSQEALRWLTVVFATLFILALYGLVRQVGQSPVIAGLVALTALASPVLLGLSFTFMTDVPGAALVSLALLAFAASYGTQSVRAGLYFLLGAGLLLAAVLLRQTAIAVCFGIIVADLYRAGWRFGGAVRGLALLAACAFVLIILPLALVATTGLPAAYSAKSDGLSMLVSDLAGLRLGALKPAFAAMLQLVGYLGLLCLPLLPLFLGALGGSRGKLLVGLGFPALLGTTAALAMNRSVMGGAVGDVLTSEGLLPRLVYGAVPEVMVLSASLTLVCFWAAFVAIAAAVQGWRGWKAAASSGGDARMPVVLLVATTALASYAPHGLTYAALFDRYTLLPASLILVVLAGMAPVQINRTMRFAPVVLPAFLSGALIVVSVTFLNDDFRWHRARQMISNEATATLGVVPELIDSGFEPINLAHVLALPEVAYSLGLVDASDRPFRVARDVSHCGEILLRTELTEVFGFRKSTLFLCRRPDGATQAG